MISNPLVRNAIGNISVLLWLNPSRSQESYGQRAQKLLWTSLLMLYRDVTLTSGTVSRDEIERLNLPPDGYRLLILSVYDGTHLDNRQQPFTPRQGPEGKRKGRLPDLTNDASTVSDSGRSSAHQVSWLEV